jgi:cytochrome c553
MVGVILCLSLITCSSLDEPDVTGPAAGDCPETPGGDIASIAVFLKKRCYKQLGWEGDVRVRPTGPVIVGSEVSVHGDVRVYYPAALTSWLRAGKSADERLPDGTLIVKEQYGNHTSASAGVQDGWTVMYKDASVSWDGWLWGYIGESTSDYDELGSFVGYCVACHVSADNAELTFADLQNLTDAKIDNFDHVPKGILNGLKARLGGLSTSCNAKTYTFPTPLAEPRSDALALYASISDSPRADVQAIPGRSASHAPPTAGKPTHFVNAGICGGCHDATSLMKGVKPHMLEERDCEQFNVSPFA